MLEISVIADGISDTGLEPQPQSSVSLRADEEEEQGNPIDRDIEDENSLVREDRDLEEKNRDLEEKNSFAEGEKAEDMEDSTVEEGDSEGKNTYEDEEQTEESIERVMESKKRKITAVKTKGIIDLFYFALCTCNYNKYMLYLH